MTGVATQEFKTVGLSFVDAYPANLHQLAALLEDRERSSGWQAVNEGDVTPGLPAVLVRNPDNEFDPNAVEVHVPVLGRRTGMIGHVPAAVAARLAPSMDGGAEWAARLVRVLVTDGHPDRPGALIVIEREP
jgi:hypothetical protein